MIQTVKLQGQGYLLNGTMSVPMADGNTEYEMIKIWLETNTPEPEFTSTELAQQTIDKQVQEYKAYLNATDHKTFSDYEPKQGEVISDIIAQRKVARDYIRANQK